MQKYTKVPAVFIGFDSKRYNFFPIKDPITEVNAIEYSLSIILPVFISEANSNKPY